MNTDTSDGLIGPARLLHAMIRVRDLDRSLDFYVGKPGMRRLRRRKFPEGRFTLAFVGYGDEAHDTVIELTHNRGDHDYALGTGFGHRALGVANVVAALEHPGTARRRPSGDAKNGSSGRSADPATADPQGPESGRTGVACVSNATLAGDLQELLLGHLGGVAFASADPCL